MPSSLLGGAATLDYIPAPHGASAIAVPVRRRRARVRVPFAVGMLLVYLGAITIFGKGPTYLGVPPLYWGEIVLGLLLVWMFNRPTALKAAASRVPVLSIALLLFLTLGAVRTAQGFGEWKLEALRDAAMWYYGAFFFIGLYITRFEPVAEKFWRTLSVIWVGALIWGSLDLATHGAVSQMGPIMPWRGVGVLSNTGSELGQNVALGAVILLSGYTLRKFRSVGLRTIPALAGLGLFAASYGRGQKVGFAIGIMVVLALTLGHRRPPAFPKRIAIFLVFCTVLALAMGSLAGIDIMKATQFDRFLDTDPAAQEGTHYWRIIWWERLETAVFSQNPLFGLGFGLNLCVYNPYLVGTEDLEWVARSPHNFNMTVFSRMGLAGVALWFSILALGIGRLIVRSWTGTIGAQPYSPARREELFFWIVMLITTWVNSSFGVLMEGPVLGIWFWLALGFATGRSLSTGRAPGFVAWPIARSRRRVLA